MQIILLTYLQADLPALFMHRFPMVRECDLIFLCMLEFEDQMRRIVSAFPKVSQLQILKMLCGTTVEILF